MRRNSTLCYMEMKFLCIDVAGERLNVFLDTANSSVLIW